MLSQSDMAGILDPPNMNRYLMLERADYVRKNPRCFVCPRPSAGSLAPRANDPHAEKGRDCFQGGQRLFLGAASREGQRLFLGQAGAVSRVEPSQ